MKILIDFTQIPLQKVGVGVYALNLVARLHALDRLNTYVILAQDDDRALDRITADNFRIIRVKSAFFRKLIFRFIMEQVYIPLLVFRYRIDLCHSVHYSFPVLAPCKKIVTICDMTFFKHPEYHVPGKIIYFRFFIWLSSVFADDIIAISQSTINDFHDAFSYAKHKGHVVYLGKDNRFKPESDPAKIHPIKLALGIKKEYFLFIGTLEPRKNIARIIEAFHMVLRSSKKYQLVVAGKKGWYYDNIFRLVESLDLQNDVLFTGFLNEDDKPLLLAGAKAFIYPSLYEGFGIPILEALACAVPTITSNISSMPELSGNAAILINPLQVEELCEAMNTVITNESVVHELQQKSIEQAKKFTWDRTARETITVYQLVVQS